MINYTLARYYIGTKRKLKLMRNAMYICLGVLIPLVLPIVILEAHGIALIWLELVALLAFFGFVISGGLCSLLFIWGIFLGLYSSPILTRQLRKALTPASAGNKATARGAEVQAKRKRAREWINKSFVVKFDRGIWCVIVRVPVRVADLTNFNSNLDIIADRLAELSGSRSSGWESLTIPGSVPAYYKVMLLRK